MGHSSNYMFKIFCTDNLKKLNNCNWVYYCDNMRKRIYYNITSQSFIF